MALPTYTPGSDWLKAMFALATEISELATAQQFVGAASAAAARSGKMYLHGTTRVDEQLAPPAKKIAFAGIFPAIIIGLPDGEAYSIIKIATGTSAKSGIFEVKFLDVIDESIDESMQETIFQDRAGKVVEELSKVQNFEALDITLKAMGRNQKEGELPNNWLQGAFFDVTWGVQGGDE